MHFFAATFDDNTIKTAISVLSACIAHLYWQGLRHRDRHDKTKERVSRLENAIASCPVPQCPLQNRTSTSSGGNGEPVTTYCLRRRFAAELRANPN